MAKGVLVHRADSKYDDIPIERYQFPKRYLNRMRAYEGDWIVYYEPGTHGGRRSYTAIAFVEQVVPDPTDADMYLALIKPLSYLPFSKIVPHQDARGFMESELRKADGSLNTGRVQWAVRPISDQDFFRIVALGAPQDDAILQRSDDLETPVEGDSIFAESAQPDLDADRQRFEQIVSRVNRDRTFRRIVLDAYDSRCAITGLKLINGGGRAEVEAAHIKPVSENGPDIVQNGIALSGTVHWMFDRGLISLSDDMDIMVSRHVNNADQIWAMVNETRKAKVPEAAALRPHPRYLEWHRTGPFKV